MTLSINIGDTNAVMQKRVEVFRMDKTEMLAVKPATVPLCR